MELEMLDQIMNKDIDSIIKLLEEAKKTRNYFKKATLIGKVNQACLDYDFYWTEKLHDLID